MKIAIISDIHENFHNLILALEEMQNNEVDQILCLGDLMNTGIAKLLAAQDIPVYMIWGNNDGEKVEITLASKRENSSLTVSLNTYDFLQLDRKKIFISHYFDLAEPMAKSGEYDAVFFGHNHMQSIKKISNCWVVNPGEIAANKTKKASMAIYDTKQDTVEVIELKNTLSLKTPLMEAYFKEHGAKMGLRSARAFGLLSGQKGVIPSTSPIYKSLEHSAKTAKAVIFSGLPGVGKSLYINEFKMMAALKDRKVTVIQWDIARKSFETPEIFERFPMGAGIVHNGVKLCTGVWLMNTIQDWLASSYDEKDLLLIEAPLVGHRFVELAKIQDDTKLESFLSSKDVHFIVPIPSKEIREKIEAARAAQVSEDTKVWMGAKPSVMLMIWKMICGVANDMGRDIIMDGQPPYDPEVYEFVFSQILKHRQYIPLHIDEVFDVNIENEKDLHNMNSLFASSTTANKIALNIMASYPTDTEIDKEVEKWYST